MRIPAAVATAVASLALLGTAWHIGVAPAVTAPTPVVAAAGPATPLPPGAQTPPSPVTVDGPVVATRYGDVQVRVTVEGGRLTDVVPLRLTDADGTSRRISAAAAPVLRQEALDLQSARIDSVSSATYTSQAYARSLQAALDAAGAS